jgi:hypothetical protein
MRKKHTIVKKSDKLWRDLLTKADGPSSTIASSGEEDTTRIFSC